MKNPLDGFYFVEKNGFGQQQYFIQIVPTTYYSKYRETLETNQYAFTSHHNTIDPEDIQPSLPGVFFRYDINPVKISIFTEFQPIHSLITRILAVVGGTWTILTIVYKTTAWVLNITGVSSNKKKL